MRATIHRSIPILFAALVAAAILAPGPSRATMALAQNDPAPRLMGSTPSGERIAVDWADSTVTLVNFWATWCEPCLTEMPRLQALHDLHQDQGLRIVGVSKDDNDPGLVSSHLAKLGITYTVLLDGDRIARVWGGVGILPTSFLIGREGKVLRRYVGGKEETVDIIVSDVEAALEGRPLSAPVHRDRAVEPADDGASGTPPPGDAGRE